MSGRIAFSVMAVSMSVSPFCIEEVDTFMFMTSAPRRLPASSKELCVRVEASKNRLMSVRPRSTSRFLMTGRLPSAALSARSRRVPISPADRFSHVRRWRRTKEALATGLVIKAGAISRLPGARKPALDSVAHGWRRKPVPPQAEGREPPRGARPSPPAASPTPSSAKRNLKIGLVSDRGLLLRLGCRLRRLGGCGRGRRRGHAGSEDLAVAAPRLRRLERAPGVEIAIGKARDLLLAAEVEVGLLRVADRPAAAALGERLDVPALGRRDHQLLGRRRVGLGVAEIELPQRRVADGGEARLDQPLGLLRARARPVRLHARRRGAAGQTEAVHLADDGIARDPSEPSGDLAGAEAVRPKLLQEFDPLVVPGHALVLPMCNGGMGTRSRAFRPTPDRPGKTFEVQTSTSER